MTNYTIKVTANADLDDCLMGAAEEFIANHSKLRDYEPADLSPRWGDSNHETVALTVPASIFHDDLTWHVPPCNGGQIVEVAYASDDGYMYRRTTDRSDQTVMLERVNWSELDDSVEFEPWNDEPDVDESDWQVAS